MYNLTPKELELLTDLIQDELNSMSDDTPASLVTQYLVILEKLKTNEND